MATKTPTPELFDRLRATGLRKRVARDLSDALSKAGNTRASQAAHGTIGELRKLVEELEDRASGGPQKRSTAAKKAATKKAATKKAAAKKAPAKKAAAKKPAAKKPAAKKAAKKAAPAAPTAPAAAPAAPAAKTALSPAAAWPFPTGNKP